MKYVPLETLLAQSKGSLYRLVILVARRARQIAGGEKALIDKPNPDKPLRTALEEIRRGYLKIN